MSNAGPYRIGNRAGGRRVEFRFDGRVLAGVEGDSIASALLANGIRVVSRSFKFHRPRGVFSAGFEEPNALMQLHSGAHAIPCVRATVVPLEDNLEVTSQFGWPSLAHDALRAFDFVHPVFAAGFYNKAFMWPSWHFFEGMIRKLAGLGRVPTAPDPDRYETRHAHVDVLVIGGGAAGIDAAERAAATGSRVLLVEQEPQFGVDINGLAPRTNLKLLPRTMAVAYYDHELVTLVESVAAGAGKVSPRERLWLVRAKKVVLATGAIEQPIIFSNNDRPGVMLAGSALKFLRRHGIAPGREVVVATNNDSAYLAARELCEAGVKITVLVDSRETPPQRLLDEMSRLNVSTQTRSMPVDSRGFGALKYAVVGTLDAANAVSHIRKIPCDALLVSGGWSPTLHLFAQAGGKLRFAEDTRAFAPTGAWPNLDIVGTAGEATPQNLGPRLSPVGNSARQFIDLRHDVTVADVELAVRENFTAVEHIKRHTTLGMSVDQGKIGQAPGAEVIARARGVLPSELGPTTFRPPFVPVSLGALVGRNLGELFSPYRRTPLHPQQLEAGAVFEDYGEWQRAASFTRSGETQQQAIAREVRLVRQGVGLYDASPLGKIELIGPDALDFTDRFYINNLVGLKSGRARYGIMLRETGVIFDDGTISVLDHDRVLLTTTSSGAHRVAAWLEEWRQCEWPEARVIVAPVTEHWATLSIAGPHARSLLERLKPECDLANDAFPHLGMRVTRLLGNEARIYRVSFSGELTYEINVPAETGAQLWSALLEEGRTFGIAPYGVEALLHLRMEKGFLHIGADTDGTTVPDDVGWGKPAASKQRHYVGKRSLSLPENVRPDRLQLIGLEGKHPAAPVVGAHLRLPASREATDGWITSAGLLSTDGKPVAMAMLRTGRSQLGQTVTVYDDGRSVTTARVVAPCFYDPCGARMNG